jgi:spore germination cell wall hydrolase CwlJ-like protein
MSRGYGPPPVDSFGMLSKIGTSFNDAYDKQNKRRSLAALGSALQIGDYAGASRAAFDSGDMRTGVAILSLGQQASASADFTNAFGGGVASGSGGGSVFPSISGSAPAAAGRGQAFSPPSTNGVHVAENEADVQRLERATGMVTDPRDIDAVARTTWGEAANEGPLGQQSVAAVIRNRASQSGMTPADVVRAEGQFEPWGNPAARARMEALSPSSSAYQNIVAATLPVMRGEVDPTGGADHFYAPKAQAALGRAAPSWDDGTGRDIGNHRFFARGYAGAPPVAAAQPGARPPGTVGAFDGLPGTDYTIARGQVASNDPAVVPTTPAGRMGALTGGASDPRAEAALRPALDAANQGNPSSRIGALNKVLANPYLPDNLRQLGMVHLKQAIDDTKAPEGVREFLWAKAQGMTQAKTPAEYDREKKTDAGDTINAQVGARTEQARTLGLDPNAPETKHYILTGSLPEAGTKITSEVAQRRQSAADLGLKPGDPGFQSYALTGKMPREDQQPLSATDKKAILEADQAVSVNESTIDSLRQAKELSRKAYAGPLASLRGTVTGLAGSEAGQATTEYDNLVTTTSLNQLKALFGGNPTEGERKALLDIQGSSSQPDAVRQRILDRTIGLAETRLRLNKDRSNELRGGSYFKPGATRDPGPQGGGAPAPAPTPQRAASPTPEPRQAPDGNWYVADPTRPGKFLQVVQ